MTYCLGLFVESGLVCIADSRTNAGVDNVATFAKLFEFGIPGERWIVIMTSGNLSVTQTVLSLLQEDIDTHAPENLYTLPTMHAIARYIGSKNRQIIEANRQLLAQNQIPAEAQLIVAGQVKGATHAVFLVYAEGNAIQATAETPFMQIGETKYGKTILDRAFRYESDLDSAARAAIISMDATMRSNLSVGPPIDIVAYTTNAFAVSRRRRFPDRDQFLIDFRRTWEQELQDLIARMPLVPWD